MIKICDNVKNEILYATSFKKAMNIAKNRCKSHNKKCVIIIGTGVITIAEVVL